MPTNSALVTDGCLAALRASFSAAQRGRQALTKCRSCDNHAVRAMKPTGRHLQIN
jgi:hypothetical protein